MSIMGIAIERMAPKSDMAQDAKNRRPAQSQTAVLQPGQTPDPP